ALAHATLALALHAAARHEEARASLARARSLAGSSEMLVVRLEVAVAAGRVEAADDPAAAARTLDAAAEEARRSGFVLHELEARLARAEAAVAAGDGADAGRRFAAVGKEARSRALMGIARRAETGRRSSGRS
ncbi:MAG TPA: hypothetical protein VJU18_15815, partial [Vicinamibacteria bacterium]|nr:hypothetical protein [Vicinamibacteria bacterium]